jgi:hypothetical protein
LELR